MALKVKKLSDNAQIPQRGSTGAAGYDLYSTETQVIMPNKRSVVSTGVAVELPQGVYGRIAPRSGLAVKHGIGIGAGPPVADILEIPDRAGLASHEGNHLAQIKTGAAAKGDHAVVPTRLIRLNASGHVLADGVPLHLREEPTLEARRAAHLDGASRDLGAR